MRNILRTGSALTLTVAIMLAEAPLSFAESPVRLALRNPEYSTVTQISTVRRRKQAGMMLKAATKGAVTTSPAPVHSLTPLQDSICTRIKQRFSGASLLRVSARIQKKFSFMCGA